MPMNANVLAAAITVRLLSLWRSSPPPENATDGNYFLTQLGLVIAQEVVAHITANANATGTDSSGDTHNLSIV